MNEKKIRVPCNFNNEKLILILREFLSPLLTVSFVDTP